MPSGLRKHSLNLLNRGLDEKKDKILAELSASKNRSVLMSDISSSAVHERVSSIP